jgi:hypothetical protein
MYVCCPDSDRLIRMFPAEALKAVAGNRSSA